MFCFYNNIKEGEENMVISLVQKCSYAAYGQNYRSNVPETNSKKALNTSFQGYKELDSNLKTKLHLSIGAAITGGAGIITYFLSKKHNIHAMIPVSLLVLGCLFAGASFCFGNENIKKS